MNAIEFESTVAENGQLTLPVEIAREIPSGEPLRVVVMWGPSDLDLAWRATGNERFTAAYAPEDSIYEELINDPSVR